MKFKIFIYALFILSFSQVVYAQKNKSYKSLVVIGHMYSLYEYYGHKERIYDYSNLEKLLKEIKKIKQVESVVLLGDTFYDDDEEVINKIYSNFINKIELPVKMILANHEVNYNLRKFIDLGGKLKDVLSFDDFRIVMYSPWKKIKNKLQIRITREDLTYFEENLSKNNENIVFITDMLHHNNVDFKGDLDWENITTILKKFNVKYVIVGDNDHVGHSYSWISLKDIKYIHIYPHG